MIDLYSGTPGSGKSLHAMAVIRMALLTGKPVICNFGVNVDLLRPAAAERYIYVGNDQLTPDLLRALSKIWFAGRRVREDQILLVIDEAQILFNARAFQARDRAAWVSFFSQHRKYGYHVLLISQYDRMLDRQIRAMIEYEWVHRKVGNFGLKGWILSLLAGGKLHVAVRVWYPLKQKVGSQFFKARKRLYALYDTYTEFAAPSP